MTQGSRCTLPGAGEAHCSLSNTAHGPQALPSAARDPARGPGLTDQPKLDSAADSDILPQAGAASEAERGRGRCDGRGPGNGWVCGYGGPAPVTLRAG